MKKVVESLIESIASELQIELNSFFNDFKKLLLEQNISLIDKYFIYLIYGENIGMRDDIKSQIKIYFKSYEKVLFTQEEILKKKRYSHEQVENTSLFSNKKLYS